MTSMMMSSWVPVRSTDVMKGRLPSNRTSTTLPRTAVTEPYATGDGAVGNGAVAEDIGVECTEAAIDD
jgi:hypothetical protein